MSESGDWIQDWMKRLIVTIHTYRFIVIFSAVVILLILQHIEHVLLHPRIYGPAMSLLLVEISFIILILKRWSILVNFLALTYTVFIVIATFNSSFWTPYDLYLSFWFLPSIFELLLFLLLISIAINRVRIQSHEKSPLPQTDK